MNYKNKKLILIGGSNGSVHLVNYYNLIKDYFDEILIVTNSKVDFCNHEVLNFSIKNPIVVIKSIKKLNKIINEFEPSIIHVHQANSYAFIAIKANKGNYPIILTTWGSDVLLLPKQSLILKQLVKYNLKKTNYITADAKFMADEIEGLVGRKDTVIANFGIELNTIEIPAKENIIYSNRLHNDLYNIDEIIVGFSNFIKNNKNWKLVIGANGKNSEVLKALAKEMIPSKNYEFIGFVNHHENRAQYLKAKIWISVPSSDGTAISLLEAMAYGCIPVLSELPANREWVDDNINGVIVENNIEEALTKANLLPLREIQKMNSAIIKARATKKANKKKFESIYNLILNCND